MESLYVLQITQHFILMHFHWIYTVGAWCKIHKYVQCVKKFQNIEPSLFIRNTSQSIVNVGWVEHKHIYKKQNEMNKTQHNKTVGGQYNNFLCCIELPNGSHLVKQSENCIKRQNWEDEKMKKWKKKNRMEMLAGRCWVHLHLKVFSSMGGDRNVSNYLSEFKMANVLPSVLLLSIP